jgi:ABC-type transporter Mla subunit MlaD
VPSLAEQGLQATEAIADALASALRGLPGRLRELEVPRVKRTLEEVADQLAAIALRLRKLSQHLEAASAGLSNATLQDSGKLIIEGFEAFASIAQFLRPGEHGVLRWLPRPVMQPYLDALGRIEAGLRAAGDLLKLGVNAVPSVSTGLKDVADDLDRAADLLHATSRTVRELSGLFPI